MKKIAVLLACYNRVQVTLNCLIRFSRQVLPVGCKCDIYIVDDASPDQTGKLVEDKFPHVKVIEGTGNLYWCGGMRLAWKTASACEDYDFYLWLNDDTFLVDDALAILFKDYESVANSGNDGIIVGTLYTADGSNNISYGCTNEKEGRVYPNGSPQLFSALMAGNFVLVPQTIYKAIGTLSAEFTHGIGDYDYAYRTRKAGFKTWCSSQVLGVCHANLGFDTAKLLDMSLSERVRVLYAPKGFALREYCAYKRRHWGLVWIFSWVKAWIRILFPRMFFSKAEATKNAL